MAAYKNKVRVAAHRGNSCVCPENTLVAMRSALELPVDMLEIDLHMTKDGHIILMHDHAVDRTTDPTGLIRDYTLAQLRAMDPGSWKGEAFRGERVPLFEEFLGFRTVQGFLGISELTSPWDSLLSCDYNVQ